MPSLGSPADAARLPAVACSEQHTAEVAAAGNMFFADEARNYGDDPVARQASDACERRSAEYTA